MTGRFEIVDTPLAGLKLLHRRRMGDDRGWLERLFCADELASAGWVWPIAQINRTLTVNKGTVRGMHFQHPPHEEAKLVTCLRGEVLDVAVDLRKNSPTYLGWHGEILSGKNAASLLIPPGFAHGFQTLTSDVEMFYVHSAPYAPQAEDGVRADDPAIAIAWPLEIAERSERDRNFSLVEEREAK
ncbi:dTDP-4-dehydrorhamnose 3,5-epimerase [Parvibaculum lavamentivorans DS-1]|uniref:dTDP-4-dehydrorhamnose 3,5-epimerase n=1 Tax=Parvibaculum lavamentivorans (strain DS-1 / DSM 13023 / NCIMB 13966) TaxID=402881 RepID=A7HYH2_PARL1|nr:dTDP-4-dehydrorhamnose 3,5-epimerase family protein [Parvibaculum lavamentivorans]ABS64955.1 dTDP-4-dehydrorhamnose 3,5-epimerase [Parvibaculum lavamentivorans DS-1]